MAVTENTYTQSGSTTNYSFTFPYLKQSDVKITVAGTASTAWTFHNATTIKFNTAPANGASIRIYRDTSDANLSATFYAGSAIKSQDLNDNFTQNLYVTQEAKRDVVAAWQSGDETIDSTETWVSNNERVATTGAIDGRVDAKIDTALTTDVVGGDRITVTDNSPSSGKITIKVTPDSIVNADVNSSAAIAQSKLNIADATASASGYMSGADKAKLTGIETAATADQTNAEIRTAVEAASDSNVFTDADHSKLNAIEALATADQTDAEIRTAVEAASNSNVFTDADHSKLNAIEASATADQTASEIKSLYESNAQTNPLTDAEKQVIDGVTSNTSELNKLDGFTGSTNDLNIVSGKSFKTSSGTLDTTSDTEIPSSKAIAAHVASSQTAIGGFVTIADEIAFPNTQPATGVVISINNAAGVVVNGSGVSTTGRRVDSTVVTINGFPSSLNGETLAAGVGLVVTATSTANTYAYHKLLAAETDVKQLSDDINDFNARYRVASSAPGSSNDAGDMYFDTSANKMKVYNGTTNAWDDVASVGSFYVNTISSSSGTGGGSATFNNNAYRFTLSNAGTSAQQHIVSVNGVIQKPNTGTSQPSEGFAISGNDIIFAAAPASGSDSFIITCGSSVSIGTPSTNSVNSSHIIDGSIVNGDISNSADIAGSKLADDSIPEAKLDVHNAPSGTDKFLKYTSNGMEWAVPPVTDISGKANLSGADFTGAITSTGNISTSSGLLRSQKAGVGQTFIQLDADLGSNNNRVLNIIGPDTDNGTAPYTFQTGNAFDFKTDNTSAIEINSGGTPKLKYAGNTKLETTSSGINVTGQINVNGSPLSAAPEISATASGAIGAGKAVIVNGNGTVSQPAITAPAFGSATQITTSNTNGSHDIIWCETHSCFIYAWRDEANNNYGKIKAGTLSGTTITWGSEVTYHGGNAYHNKLAYDPVNDVIFIAYRNGGYSYRCEVRQIQISGTTIGTVSAAGTPYSNHNTTEHNLACNASGSCILTFKYASQGRAVRIYANTNASNHPNMTASYQIESNNYNYNALAYDPDEDKFVTCWNDQDSQAGRSRVMTIESNGSISMSSTTDWINDYTNYISLSYNTEYNKFLCVFQRVQSNGINLLYSVVGTYSGGTITWSTEVQHSSTANRNHINSVYNPITYKHSVYWQAGNDSNKLKHADITISGTTPSLGTVTVLSTIGSDGEYNETAASNAGAEVNISDTSNDEYYVARSPQSTSANSTSFIGFASAAYSNGNTATVKVTGNTLTGLSGLTAGAKAYVQANGDVSSTVSNPIIEAGIALSSTKLLIKG